MSEHVHIGRYRVLRLLGQGGAGQVYEAELVGPAGFRKRVALKLLKSGPAADDQEARALAREARLGALLSHPNVVSTLELGVVDDEWFVAMELVRGLSLGRLVESGPLPPSAVLEVGIQACAGLAHIHSLTHEGQPLGLVHRDVKLQNLMIDRTGLVKVADLGIAQLASGPGRPAGTPGYLAPEQALGQAEARSDLFALGVVLMRIATGEAPLGTGHEGVNAAHHIEARLADPAFLAPVDRAVPGLAAVVRRCLRHDPSDRIASAGALGAALRALRARHPTGGALAAVLAARIPDLHPDEWVGSSTADTPVSAPERPRVRLPTRPDRFVGRDADRAALRAALDRTSLVSLIGPAGVGKTRLALELAAELEAEWLGGAVFCDLSECHDADALCAALAVALDIRNITGVEALGHALAQGPRRLVVLDNAEGIAAAAPHTIAHWVDVGSAARLLVTSRVALRLRGEHQHPLEPLPEADAIALFEARADRPVPPTDHEVLGSLVAELDGLPLAIELAAARVGALTVRELLAQLQDRFKLLSRAARDSSSRHATLRTAIDASWDLLTEWERAAWAQLSVFAGGFTLQAADAVLDLTAWPRAPWTLDVLTSLMDHSLLRLSPDHVRFTQLLSLHAYGEEKLAAIGAVRVPGGDTWSGPDAVRATELRHGEFFARSGSREARAALRGPEGTRMARALGSEVDNLLAATRRAVARADAGVAVGACMAAAEIAELRGPLTRIPPLVEATLPLAPDAERGPLLRARGWALYRIGRAQEGYETMAAALPGVRAQGDLALEATLLWGMAATSRATGRIDEAVHFADRSLDAAQRSGDPRALAAVQSNRATLLQVLGHHEEARQLVNEALEGFRLVGDERGVGIALSNLGVILQSSGRREQALEQFEAALSIHRAVGDRQFEALTMAQVATALHQLGQFEHALPRYRDSIALFRLVGARPQVAYATVNLGELHLDRGDLDEAESALRDSMAISATTQDRVTEGRARHLLGEVLFRRGDLDEAHEQFTRAEALLRPTAPPSELAEMLARFSRLLAARGERDRAEAQLAEVRTLEPAGGHAPGHHIERLVAEAEAALAGP